MGIERGGLKTWSALAGNKKRPSEYEIVTYKLHYRNRKPDAAYEQSPDSMMNRWYRKHVRDSLLKHDDWDAFRDPDQVTYRSYTAMQDAHEEYVDGLLKNHTDTGHDSKLKSEWVGEAEVALHPAALLDDDAADGQRVHRADGTSEHDYQLRSVSRSGLVPVALPYGISYEAVVARLPRSWLRNQ